MGKDKEYDEMVMPEVVIDMKVPEAVNMQRPESGEFEAVPRRMYLKAKDFENHGFSAGCRGCIALMRGDQRSVHHDEDCRKRMTRALKITEDGKKRKKGPRSVSIGSSRS